MRLTILTVAAATVVWSLAPSIAGAVARANCPICQHQAASHADYQLTANGGNGGTQRGRGRRR